MRIKNFIFTAACCLLAGLAAPAAARPISYAPISGSTTDFAGTPVSTSSILWTWSTGNYTGAAVQGFNLYSSTASTSPLVLAAGTSFYLDAGLGSNKPVTRWVRAFNGSDESPLIAAVTRYSYATPPDTLTYNSVTSTSAFLRWNYSAATAYAIETSTDNGASYVRLRDAFVPWQVVDLLSNSNYTVRLGAVNNDNVMTPAIYSSTVQFTTYPLDPVMTAVAISSYAIQWQWSTGPFTGTGITGYHIYRASPTADGELPTADDIEVLMHTSLGAGTSYWIETYVDVVTTETLVAVANSRHTRWVKAYGFLESTKLDPVRKYTYAVSADSCTVTYFDPEPAMVTHIEENSVTLNWRTGFSTTTLNGIASSYNIEYSTVGDFTAALGTVSVGGSPSAVPGLLSNTKYDLIVRPVNGDGEVTPENAFNPYARTGFEKIMTQPEPPYNFAAVPRTDTMIGFTWSTMTYSNTTYIDGYALAAYSYRNGILLHSTSTIAYGIAQTTFTADYMLTNSTNTCSIQTHQVDPTWNLAPNFWKYTHIGSDYLYTQGATFATPPNDVSFSTVGARFVNLWWNEPLVPATKYRVEYSTTLGEGGPWSLLADITGSTYTHTGLTPSTTYSYRIGAINLLGQVTAGLPAYTDGNRRDYSFVRSTLTKHVSPTMVGTALSSTSINWTWTDTFPGVTAYNVYTASNGFLASLPGANTGYVETGLQGANTSYTRLLRSVAPDGVGDYSETTVFTLANNPAALTVTSSGTSSIGLSWAANGSTRYGLYRSRDGANWTAVKSWASAFTSAAYSDAGLLYNTSYYYAVVGFNGDGVVSPSSSTLVNRTLPLPSTYTVLYATAGAQTVTAPMAGLGLLTVTLPAGLPDGYLLLSTNAATAPVEVPKASVDAATAKLSGVALIPGSVVELRLFDSSGTLLTSNLAAPARLKLGYLDVNADDMVDGVAPPADVRTLRIFTLNTTALTWDKLSNSVLDRSAQNVYADIPHFSIYMLGSVTSAVGPLAGAFAYPNPYRPGSAGQFGQSAYGDGIVFEGLPAYAKVRVFSLAGAEVADFDDADGDGRAIWDARNKSGSKAASGVYLYVITPRTGGGKKTGRVSIIR